MSTEAGAVAKFVAVVGLPRSGTTLLTALIDAHSEAGLYFEPFNSRKKARPAVPEDLAGFLRTMAASFGYELDAAVSVAGFKETTILPESTAWAVATTDAVARAVPAEVVWIVRHPIHCLLSKIEAAREHWGFPDAAFTRESLEGFLVETAPSLAALEDLVARHPSSLVAYDSLVADPAAVLGALMPRLGLEFDPVQLDYHEQGARPDRVMGDPGLSSDPQPVSAEQATRRAAELESHRALVDEILALPAHAALRDVFARLDEVTGVVTRG